MTRALLAVAGVGLAAWFAGTVWAVRCIVRDLRRQRRGEVEYLFEVDDEGAQRLADSLRLEAGRRRRR